MAEALTLPRRALLIDTDVLIDFSRGVEKARTALAEWEAEYDLSVSVITQLELLVGCEDRSDFRAVQNFVDLFRVFPIDPVASEISVQLFEKYRLSHGVKIPDTPIAATALAHDIPLASKNQKDFIFIDGLKLLEYSV